MVDVGDSDSSGRCYALSLQHLLNAHYLLLGLCTGVVGPSLLDLADVYGTDVTTIASSKIAVAVGGIVGAVGAYFAMSLLSRHKLAVMSVLVAAAGGATALMPMLGMVWLLMADMAVRGAANSALHAGSNVVCVETWRGGNGGPHMHFMHFCFSVGSFVAPLLVKPFLGGTKQVASTNSSTNSSSSSGGSSVTVVSESEETRIGVLYLVCGLAMFPVAAAFLAVGLRKSLSLRERRSFDPARALGAQEPRRVYLLSGSDRVLVSMVFVFLCAQIGVEFAVPSYLPTFAVLSRLGQTKAEAADTLAFFQGAMVASRVATALAATRAGPDAIVALNGLLIVAGNCVLLLFAEDSALLLRIGYVLLGLGCGTAFSNTWLWMDQYFKVEGKVGSFLMIGDGVAMLFTSILFGPLIGTFPRILLYFQVGAAVTYVLVFGLGSLIGERRSRDVGDVGTKEDEDEEAEDEREVTKL